MSYEAIKGELDLSAVQKMAFRAKKYVLGPDSKRPGKIFFRVLEPNSFGIPAMVTCPGKTDYCQSDCYARNCEYYPEANDKMLRNLDILKEDETVEGMTGKLRNLISTYAEQTTRLNIPKESQIFRIHWDGDFFSTDYAKSWRNVIEENPEIRFWVYTRSFQPKVNVVPILSGLKNLELYLSVDYQNIDFAEKVLAENPQVKVAYLVDYFEDVEPLIKQLGRDEGHKTRPCPENITKDNGEPKIPLITEEGGACHKCKYCLGINERHDVVFVKEKKLFRAIQELPFTDLEPAKNQPRRIKIETQAQPVGEVALSQDLSLF